MTDYQTFLLRLNQNLQIFQERSAKYAGNPPLDLLNQIEDHRQAIALTEQAHAGQFTESEWFEALQPLLIAGPGIDLLTVWILSKYAFDQGMTLGQSMGPQALDSAKVIFSLSMDHLRQSPKGELIAAEFEQDPLTYEKPIEKAVGELIRADVAFAEQLRTMLEQLYQALKTHNAVAPGATYQATQKGRGQLVQGEQPIGVQQQDQGQAAVHSHIEGDMLAAGASKTVIVVAESFWRQFAPAQMSFRWKDLQQATARYLTHLIQRYQYLDFKGMGVSDRVALRMPLLEMYVPLKARIEMPAGETWSRELRLAGRQVSPEEAEAMGQRLSELQQLLELLRRHAGLIILGDPGAGKTTFLKFLTLRLALGEGESLGLGQRLPILVPLSAYANALDQSDVPLDEFIVSYHRQRGIKLPLEAVLAEALERGGVLLLLDGLDEVRNLGQRKLVVDRVVDFFTFQQQQGNKAILTSRIVGYREVRPVVAGLAECTLVDFEEEEINQFVVQWTTALERAARGDTPIAVEEAVRERSELLDSVQRNPGVRQLASNPLLLTILALMKRQGVTLPERRVELYQKYIETLLRHWNLARGLGRPPSRDLDVVETIRVLAPVALWMHQTSPGVGLVKQAAVKRKLEEIYANRGEAEPERAAR